MAKKIVYLEYGFMFDPEETTWSSLERFEADFSVFLKARGLEAEIVNTVGGTGKKIILIRSQDKLDRMRGYKGFSDIRGSKK